MVDKTGAETIAKTFAKNGIVFYPGSNRRVDGWNLVHQYLRFDEKTNPKMMFFNTCYNAIKTIPSLIHDEIKPEDLDTKGEDHAADSVRYFLMMLHDRKSPRTENETQRKIMQRKNQRETLIEKLKNIYD
jgi:hypothetical protein